MTLADWLPSLAIAAGFWGAAIVIVAAAEWWRAR